MGICKNKPVTPTKEIIAPATIDKSVNNSQMQISNVYTSSANYLTENPQGMVQLQPLAGTYLSDQKYVSQPFGLENQSIESMNSMSLIPSSYPMDQNLQSIAELGLGQDDYLNSVNQLVPVQQGIYDVNEQGEQISNLVDPNIDLSQVQIGQPILIPGNADLSKLNFGGAQIVFNGPGGPKIISNIQEISNQNLLSVGNNLVYNNNIINPQQTTNYTSFDNNNNVINYDLSQQQTNILPNNNFMMYNIPNLSLENTNLNQNNFNQLPYSQAQYAFPNIIY